MTVDVAYFLLAARGTPQAAVDKLHGAIDKALQNPKIKDAPVPQGIEDKRSTPAEVGAYLAAEAKRRTDVGAWDRNDGLTYSAIFAMVV